MHLIDCVVKNGAKEILTKEDKENVKGKLKGKLSSLLP